MFTSIFLFFLAGHDILLIELGHSLICILKGLGDRLVLLDELLDLIIDAAVALRVPMTKQTLE